MAALAAPGHALYMVHSSGRRAAYQVLQGGRFLQASWQSQALLILLGESFTFRTSCCPPKLRGYPQVPLPPLPVGPAPLQQKVHTKQRLSNREQGSVIVGGIPVMCTTLETPPSMWMCRIHSKVRSGL